MNERDAQQGPRITPVPPPEKPRADVDSAAWWALPLPLSRRWMQPQAAPHLAAWADFSMALAALEMAHEAQVEQRLAALDRLELALSGAFGPALAHPELRPAVVLRESLLNTGGSFQDALALADACRDMIRQAVPNDMDGLRDHAARAGAPVLRHFLLLHGEQDAALLEQADELARAWFMLRLLAARQAGGHGHLPAVPGEAARQCLQRARGAWRLSANGHARAQLLRLEQLARTLLPRVERGKARLQRSGPAHALPPAEVLARALPLAARATIAWRAWRARRAPA